MPLLDRSFERGKSGFKLIQYLACGLPVIASPIGVNSSIVRNGQNGLLAGTEEEWEQGLRRLIADAGLRSRFGAEGRSLAVEHYSLASQAPRLIELFREVTATR
jgi:glycosyltransferase involved in cell wall biosynthesis